MADSVETPATHVSPYLKQVRVRDYPPLRDAKVDFKPGLNIIIGKNGAGKTRFLTLTKNLADIYNGRHTDGLGCELIIAGQYELKVAFVEQNDSTEDDLTRLLGPMPLLAAVSYGSETVHETNLYTAIDELVDDRLFLYTVVLVQHGIPTSRLPIIDESVELLVRIVLRKMATSIVLDNEAKNLNAVESQFVQELLGVIMRAIHGQLNEPKHLFTITTDGAKEGIAQAIDDYLSLLNNYLPLYSPLKAVRRSEFFQIYYNSVQGDLIIKGLVLEYQIGEDWLPFSALSDGTKRLFYLIIEVLSPLGARRSQPKIILIEEPELGVHPHQLHLLLNLIREVSREHQVILTTHAPQVLDMLGKKELDRISVCEATTKKGTQFRKLSRTKQAQARIYMQETGFLSDYWRYSYLEGDVRWSGANGHRAKVG
ncbi:hypothetical protein GCM10027422_41260 [Hymenobacter arcticus]